MDIKNKVYCVRKLDNAQPLDYFTKDSLFIIIPL